MFAALSTAARKAFATNVVLNQGTVELVRIVTSLPKTHTIHRNPYSPSPFKPLLPKFATANFKHDNPIPAPEETYHRYGSPEEVFFEEHGPLCCECACICSTPPNYLPTIKSTNFQGCARQLNDSRSAESSSKKMGVRDHGPLYESTKLSEIKVAATACGPLYDPAWKLACKNGCKEPCKRHASLFLKKKKGEEVAKVKAAVDVGACAEKVDVKDQVDETRPDIWWYRPY